MFNIKSALPVSDMKSLIAYFDMRSRGVAPLSLRRLRKPRDTVLRGVRVGKKQVNSVSRLCCERVGSLYFAYLVKSIQSLGTITCPKTALDGRH